MIGIGIDISKNKSTVSAIDDTGEIIMKPQEFKHSQNELNKLIQWIKDQEDTVFVVMESTCLLLLLSINSITTSNFLLQIWP